MGLMRSLGVSALLGGAALVYHVYGRVQREQIGYVEALRQLPAEARSLWAETRVRAAEAIEDGRQAAREREQQVTHALAAAGTGNTGE
ncbi:MAG: hypothetical protein ACLQUT_13040 [Thermoleophilia bacterium]